MSFSGVAFKIIENRRSMNSVQVTPRPGVLTEETSQTAKDVCVALVLRHGVR